MSHFLFEYGLFLAKSITIIACLVLAIGGIASIISNRKRNKEELEIENLNDLYKDYQAILEREILSQEEFKALTKERKKQDKLDKKLEKQKNKQKNKQKIKVKNTDPDKPRLFVLRFNGDLHASEVDNLREEVTAILTFAQNSDEVLVVIDSTGGIVHDYGFAASQLKRIRDKGLKLTAAVDLAAASGGYMMACVANHIIAAPFAIVGSIGVLAQVPNFHRLLDKHNIDIEHHTAGEYKSTLTLLGKNTPKARQKFQQELEETHILFKNFVKHNRPMVDIDHIATGEYWYGMDALDKKLIDEIKTSDDYLLEKSEAMDMYAVTYQFNESLKDKISSMLSAAVRKSIAHILYFLSQRNILH